MKLSTILEKLESSFLEIAIRVVSIFGPVPTAYLIFDRTMKYLDWPKPISAIAAGVIEGFGFSSIHIFLVMLQYNQDKRQKDPKAPTWIAVILIAFYFLSVISLTVLLDTLPELARFAPVVFPAISLCGAGMMILRYNHESRLRAIVEAKAKEKEERQSKKQAQVELPVAQDKMPTVQRGTFEEFIIENSKRNGNGPMRASEIMAMFKVPRRTAYNWIEKSQEMIVK